jgi:endonuclease/exonuclease/phosphatase family metal-dependent hydrolase
VAVLIRTWNLFHGNALPPERHSFLAEMLALATRDGPGVLCLQEVPVWALPRLAEWSGMRAFPAVARRGLRPARLAGWLTRLHNGFFRSLVAGQANAILVARRHSAASLGAVAVSGRGREPRVCQAVRVDDRLVVGNTHLSHRSHTREHDVELARCAAFLQAHAQAGEAVVLAGDLNHSAPLIEEFSAGADGIDHVLVRGATARPAQVWEPAQRTVGGRVLSDHAPVDVVVE